LFLDDRAVRACAPRGAVMRLRYRVANTVNTATTSQFRNDPYFSSVTFCERQSLQLQIGTNTTMLVLGRAHRTSCTSGLPAHGGSKYLSRWARGVRFMR